MNLAGLVESFAATQNKGEAPQDSANRGSQPQPQPFAQARESIGRSANDQDINDYRPGRRLARRDQERRCQRADETDAGKHGAMQRCGEHARDTDHAQRDKSKSRSDEFVKRMRGIDGAERADCASRCQHGGDAGPQGVEAIHRLQNIAGIALAPAQPFTRGNKRQRKYQSNDNARAGSKQSLQDRLTDEKQSAEGEREATNPDRPACAEAFFEAGRARGDACGAVSSREGGSDGNAPPGRGTGGRRFRRLFFTHRFLSARTGKSFGWWRGFGRSFGKCTGKCNRFRLDGRVRRGRLAHDCLAIRTPHLRQPQFCIGEPGLIGPDFRSADLMRVRAPKVRKNATGPSRKKPMPKRTSRTSIQGNSEAFGPHGFFRGRISVAQSYGTGKTRVR